MWKAASWLLVGWLFSLPGAGLEVFGCTVPISYIRPTNFELVYDTEVIVLAEAIAFKKEKRIEEVKLGKFTFRVLEVLKGKFDGKTHIDDGDTGKLDWGEGDDFGFQKGDTGLCNAENYAVGRQYVLFLSRFNDKWYVHGPAFSRINVEVAGARAPWVEGVRRYCEIAALVDYEARKKALAGLQERARKGETGCPVGLIADIEAHFKMATNYKSEEDLLALYKAATGDEERDRALWASANRTNLLMKPVVAEMLSSGTWLRFAEQICSYATVTRMSEAFETIRARLSQETNEWVRRSILLSMTHLAEEKDAGLMEETLERSKESEAELLERWFVEHPTDQAIESYRKLCKGDYREAASVTLILARMGDPVVVEWAKGDVTRASKEQWVSVYALASSPRKEADQEALKIIDKREGEALIWLVQGYAESQSPTRLERLDEIASRKRRSRKLDFWLGRTLYTIGVLSPRDADRANVILARIPKVESEP